MAPFGRGQQGWTPRGGFGGSSSWGKARANREERRQNVCRMFQAGNCTYGARCKYSHGLTDENEQEPSRVSRERKELSTEEQKAKADYNAWKRLIKSPPIRNDVLTIERLWKGALAILNGSDRDWKQMLPRDLDDEELNGREHIQAILSMVAQTHSFRDFVDLSQNFLLVITHPALLDCLSVDTFVGNLYNYISGSNGSRAIPFFRRLCTNVGLAHRNSLNPITAKGLEDALTAMSTAICELLRREPRATFHDELPDLVDHLETVTKTAATDIGSAAYQLVIRRVADLRAMRARATGLLSEEEVLQEAGISTTVVTSTYPRDVVVPRDRHDNDKMDITKIKILPTEDEFRSNHAEFLPSTDSAQPHFLADPAQRHLDTHFRLLRHDIFGELKQALGGLMVAVQNDPNLLSNPRLSLGDIRAYPYPKAHIRHISYDQRLGLEAHISFPQLPILRKKSRNEQRTWWQESKRLEDGVLLCFVSLYGDQSSILFFTVVRKHTDPKEKFNLCSDDHQSTISAKLAAWNQIDMELLLRLSCQNTRGVLIEFPGVLLATFIPILENLQSMQQQSRLPFRQWILPDRIGTNRNTSIVLDIPPPLYAQTPGFTFSLKAILKNPEDDFSLIPGTPINDTATIDELETRTPLDRGQCQALVAALFREFAFIQGPPGTGKSYLGVHLMRVLLSCKDKADLGPIVVVCYTNHALDQFLEHLVAIGIDKIIRIGGQSQSTVLEGKNLRIVSKGESRTKGEGYLLAMSYKKLEESENSITKQLWSLHSVQKRPDWDSIKRHLAFQYPRVYTQFEKIDNDGFEIVGRYPFDVWADDKSKAESENSDEAEAPLELRELLRIAAQNVHRLSLQNRRRLIEYWIEEMREGLTDEVFESVNFAEAIRKQLSNTHDEVDRRVLETADVIGVTTTGLARRIATLKHVRCKVVICEEAGEVLESHMLSAFLPSVEHFIQIGDHQQLRPQINNYSLSLESQQGLPYQLDRSQFERLSVGERGRPKLPLAQLNVQRRMRPEISTLIRETIYPRLIDHDTTRGLPDVVGMRKNVFWLDHDNMEEGASEDVHQKSHSNLWEIEFVHALVRHIVRQGVYKSSEIAVLTPYTGQLQKLRAKMRSDFEIVLSERDQDLLAIEGFIDGEAIGDSQQSDSQQGSGKKPLEKKKLSDLLRISTCDNFQGEEARVVIISLVRSNKDRKAGFLKTTNRINVLLSRAQHGMYIIGNTDTYSNIPMWSKVISMLSATNSLGTSLGLCCPRHPDTEIQVRQPEDFSRFSPEGGCQLACDQRLSTCGHRCVARCHSESMHAVFPCPQACQRLHSPCNHGCQKATCGEDCGVCMLRLNGVVLPCSHSRDNVPCYLAQGPKQIKCDVIFEKQVPGCGHFVKVQCWRDVTMETFRCSAPCGAYLSCGHVCPGSCGLCNRKDALGQSAVTHQKCTVVCGRRFGTCNHTCPRPCHDDDCGPCPFPCEVLCAHSRCKLKCHEACAPCVESCTWFCEHKGACSMPCAAPCVRLPCNLRCSKNLSCGHQCPGICGEKCPEGYCHICGGKGGARVEFLEMKSYDEIDPNETPIIVLGCGHFFTAETLDGHVGMGDVYTRDGDYEYTGRKDTAELARSVPRCPDCQRPIRQHTTHRYNRVINKAVIDEMSKRFIVSGRTELQALEQQTVELKRHLEVTCAQIAGTILRAEYDTNASQINKELNKRQEMSKRLQKAILCFSEKISDRNQPAQKLYDATLYAIRNRSITELMSQLTASDAVPAVAHNRHITLGGRVAQIKLDCIILIDKFSLIQGAEEGVENNPLKIFVNTHLGSPARLATLFFKTCMTLIEDCMKQCLWKLSVEGILYYSTIARPYGSYSRSHKTHVEDSSKHIKIAKELLEKATDICAKGFRNADIFLLAVEESKKRLGMEWYEDVSSEELAAIKAAMVSGPGGIATHSGHWYNCENGHPFTIGECGMPMERARCPECGAPIGGQHHQAVQGVTRAMNMEV